MDVAIFGGGCFWCLDAVFRELKGVKEVVSGYCGGEQAQPNYEQVCTGATGHAEVIRITFDEAAISFRELLDVFFAIHDPTTLNRQGYDVGSQYRSVIFCQNDTQRLTARAVIDELTAEQVFRSPIVTQICGEEPFYEAEGYHQNFYVTNPKQGYCEAVIAPKLAKFRAKFLG